MYACSLYDRLLVRGFGCSAQVDLRWSLALECPTVDKLAGRVPSGPRLRLLGPSWKLRDATGEGLVMMTVREKVDERKPRCATQAPAFYRELQVFQVTGSLPDGEIDVAILPEAFAYGGGGGGGDRGGGGGGDGGGDGDDEDDPDDEGSGDRIDELDVAVGCAENPMAVLAQLGHWNSEGTPSGSPATPLVAWFSDIHQEL